VKVRSARVAMAAGLGLASLTLAGPSSAGGVGDCTQSSDSTVAQTSHRQSSPLQLLQVKQAQQLAVSPGGLPGAGVNVAVVDSGTRSFGQFNVVASYSVHGPTVKVADYHGNAVAGLVAGRTRPGDRLTGVAPGAGIVDVQVYGWPHGQSGNPATVTTEQLIGGLTWLAGNAKRLHVRVAVVALAVPPAPASALAAAVRAVQRQGVLIVAPAGNRPTENVPGYLSEYAVAKPGQDGVDQIAPALEPGVLTVGTTAKGSQPAPEPTSIPNSAVDAVVPTAGGISIGLDGGNCILSAPATSWAVGEVGGVAALLFARYADESPAQIAARIVDTASGTSPDDNRPADSGDASLYFGAGVVQPVDALTRPLTPGPGGVFSRLLQQPDNAPPVRAPLPTSDALHHSRHLAIWVGLVGGALVVVASILRPLFTRRTE
jgi:membrane-anchored mycosin MYCP